MSDLLTERQADVLTKIEQHIAEHGKTPTYRALATAFGVRYQAIYAQAKTLAAKGYIRQTRRGAIPTGKPKVLHSQVPDLRAAAKALLLGYESGQGNIDDLVHQLRLSLGEDWSGAL